MRKLHHPGVQNHTPKRKIGFNTELPAFFSPQEPHTHQEGGMAQHVTKSMSTPKCSRWLHTNERAGFRQSLAPGRGSRRCTQGTQALASAVSRSSCCQRRQFKGWQWLPLLLRSPETFGKGRKGRGGGGRARSKLQRRRRSSLRSNLRLRPPGHRGREQHEGPGGS